MVNTSDILPNTPRYLKVPLIFFNAVLWILGLLLIILGGVVLNELASVKSLDLNVGISSGLIVLGVFILVLTVVGSIVAYKEQLVGLVVYTVIMLVLLVCLIGVGGAAFSYRNDTATVLNHAWNSSDVAAKVRLEKLFDCCGWGDLRTENPTVDTKCYSSIYINVTNTTQVDYNPGKLPDCQPTVTDYISSRLYIAGVAGVVIGVIEFVCMFFSLYLIIRLCRNPRSRSYD